MKGGMRMRNTHKTIVLLLVIVVVAWSAPASEAFQFGLEDLTVFARLQSRVSLRLNDADGFTNPDVSTGDVVQHRNLLLVEVDQDLKQIDTLDLRVKYHVVGRFLYEGIYDYGPGIFRDLDEEPGSGIGDLRQSTELWECYVDLSRGPLFLRLGRQNLSWGETDVFRLLDNINPLDNTFGGPFEELDDRRIPLWMLRGSYNFGMIGPLASLSLESYWVPGAWETTVGPWAPDGSPYEVPLAPDLAPFVRVFEPAEKMENSRWGVRLTGMIGSNLTLSVAHYRTYLDMPSLRTKVTPGILLLADLDNLIMEGSFPPVQVTGASANYWESHTDVVLRGEMAFYWDEPVFIPERNLGTLYGPVIPLPPAVMEFASGLLGVDLVGLGLEGLPFRPKSGDIPKKEVFRYMIGLDKQVWVRPLNRTSTFLVSLQYFGQWIPDYDARLRQPLELYPKLVEFAKVKETEHTITALVSAPYSNGRLLPQVALAYDARGTWLIQPSVSYIHGPLRYMLQYSAIEGEFTGFGAFRDRDQISLGVSFLLD